MDGAAVRTSCRRRRSRPARASRLSPPPPGSYAIGGCAHRRTLFPTRPPSCFSACWPARLCAALHCCPRLRGRKNRRSLILRALLPASPTRLASLSVQPANAAGFADMSPGPVAWPCRNGCGVVCGWWQSGEFPTLWLPGCPAMPTWARRVPVVGSSGSGTLSFRP
jgi:hypothetical protein